MSGDSQNAESIVSRNEPIKVIDRPVSVTLNTSNNHAKTALANDKPTTNKPYLFQPGNRANPGGRPKGLASRIRTLTNEGEDILKFLVGVLSNEIKSTTKDRLQAAQILLDRGYGKAVETSVQVQLDAKSGESTAAIEDLADAQLESMARQLQGTSKPVELAPLMLDEAMQKVT